MIVLIPTNREKQVTISNFSGPLLRKTHLLSYNNGICKGDMGKLRQSYLKDFKSKDPHIVMADDDLIFQTRCPIDNIHINSSKSEIEELFNWIQLKLEEGYVYVGVSNRFMVNTKPSVYYSSAPSMIYGFNADYVTENNIRFDQVPLCEDWHFALSIYESGGRNIFTSDWCVCDASSGKGGLEHSRDAKKIREAMFKFKELHPQFVTLREKENGKQQRHITGLDMRVQWKKAYRHGISK